ncbi:MAG TPA: hypothetical protein EYP35_07485 [Desulfobacterales bacterium]|nr:hypothetical protein [Desulfobacterales bacterium]HIP39943.1 hypothetical protein [Desulfocapsa sulfexigens]
MKHSKQQPPPCPGCNGTGQMTWFGGVSRFQFSYEDCPECNGFGFLIPAEQNSVITAGQITCTGLSPKKVKQFLNVLAQILSTALVKGDSIQLRGFGSFSAVSSRSAPGKIRFVNGKNLQQTLNDLK